tara:strand:- start:1651 stop:1956 length:306 start_codon:yes stop_codon:yes gene_type:complete
MSCNPTFQKAVDALKEAVKVSLDTDVKPELQSEIWRHYQGMKNIAGQIKSNHKHTSYDLDRLDNVFDYSSVAADTVSVNTFTTGDDVITFGDYKSQEYRPD